MSTGPFAALRTLVETLPSLARPQGLEPEVPILPPLSLILPCSATLRSREDSGRPGPDHALESARLVPSHATLVPEGGEPGEALRVRGEDPRTLPDLEGRHVLRDLVLPLDSSVRLPHATPNLASVRPRLVLSSCVDSPAIYHGLPPSC